MPGHGSCTSSTPLVVHPQLRIIETATTSDPHVEYRVYNWRRLSSGRVVRGDGWSLGDLIAIGVISFTFWRWGTFGRITVEDPEGLWSWDTVSTLALGIVALLYLRSCTIVVLYQSVVPLPKLGLQLSTTRGISLPHPAYPSTPGKRILVPLSTSYTFIPLSEISTVIINEGLKRWNVRYYLAVVKRRGGGVVVALGEIWAPVAVLREVYHGIRERLFDEYADAKPP